LLPGARAPDFRYISPVEFKNPGVFLQNFNSSRAKKLIFSEELLKSENLRSFQDKVRNYFAQHPEESL